MTDFLDANGQKVHAFALEMTNLGFRRMADKLLNMLEDDAWREFADGLGKYRFLPGEFDYFLSQQGITRDDIMNGIRDVETKARLEEAMDERLTGKDPAYRRPVLEARDANPTRPDRPIEPFGLTKSEAKALLGDEAATSRPALGGAVRRWRATGGETTRKPSESLPRAERIYRSAARLPDEELLELIERLKAVTHDREQERKEEP